MWCGNLCILVYRLLCKISLTSLRLIFNLAQSKSVELWCGPACQFVILWTEPLVSSLISLSKHTCQRFYPLCFLKPALLHFTYKSMMPSLWVTFSAKYNLSGGSFVIFDRCPIALVPLMNLPPPWTASVPLWNQLSILATLFLDSLLSLLVHVPSMIPLIFQYHGSARVTMQ